MENLTENKYKRNLGLDLGILQFRTKAALHELREENLAENKYKRNLDLELGISQFRTKPA
jgi:hypothetical protein